MAYRRRSTAPRGRDGSSAPMQRSRRQSQWKDTTPERKITPTFLLWCASCILLALSAAMHFSNKAKTAVVPVLKHDQAQCAEECWVRQVTGCGVIVPNTPYSKRIKYQTFKNLSTAKHMPSRRRATDAATCWRAVPLLACIEGVLLFAIPC